MNEITKNKFAEMLKAANEKANFTAKVRAIEIKVNDTVKYKNAVITAKVNSVLKDYIDAANITFSDGKKEIAAIEDLVKIEPFKMQSFTIIWHEGKADPNYDGKVFNTWQAANKALKNIFSNHSGLGYLKVKVCVKWENEKEITDRLDLSTTGGDFNPQKETVGEYLKKQKSVMYSSNIEQGERNLLSFEDEEHLPEISEEKQQANLTVVNYSDKAIAVIGETYPVKEILKRIGGRFNYNLTCGAGWIFSKAKADVLRKELNLTFVL